MDGWPKLALVATPDVGASVLYPFNVSPTSRMTAHDGVDFGTPEWTGRPGAQGGVDGFRTIRFTHRVAAEDAVATVAMATLSRLLTASSGWLLIQLLPTSAPRWARVWRSTPAALSLDRYQQDGQGPKGQYGIDVSLTADPLLVGSEVTLANAVTVNNDPAAGTNPCTLALGAVVGDAVAPARVSVTPSIRTYGVKKLLMTTQLLTGQVAPVVWQVGTSDGWTVVGLAAASSDVLYSGGSYRVTNAATATLTASKVLAAGEYLVMVKVQPPSAGGDTWRFTAYPDHPLAISVSTQVVTFLRPAYIPIGVVAFPAGVQVPVADLGGVAVTANFQLLLERISGSNTLNVDAIVLLPIGTQTRTLQQITDSRVPASDAIVAEIADGDSEIFVFGSLTTPLGKKVTVEGAFPSLVPGASNVLHLVGGMYLSGADATIATTHSVTVTYRPQWLWPAP